MRLVGFRTEPAVPVRLVVLVVSLEPHDLAVPLEGEHVRGEAIEEPAVVADDHCAPGKRQQRLLERAQRVDVEVVGRFVQEQQVRAALQQLREMDAIALTAREGPDFSLLVPPLEVEPGHIGAGRDGAFAQLDFVDCRP